MPMEAFKIKPLTVDMAMIVRPTKTHDETICVFVWSQFVGLSVAQQNPKHTIIHLNGGLSWLISTAIDDIAKELPESLW